MNQYGEVDPKWQKKTNKKDKHLPLMSSSGACSAKNLDRVRI